MHFLNSEIEFLDHENMGIDTLPKKKFLQDLETIRSMILQDLACKITMDFGTISREIMPE